MSAPDPGGVLAVVRGSITGWAMGWGWDWLTRKLLPRQTVISRIAIDLRGEPPIEFHLHSRVPSIWIRLKITNNSDAWLDVTSMSVTIDLAQEPIVHGVIAEAVHIDRRGANDKLLFVADLNPYQ